MCYAENSKGLNICCRSAERDMAELDFVIDNGTDIIPVEIKAEKFAGQRLKRISG